MRIIVLLFLIALIFVILINICEGQIISTSASHETLSIVSTETPILKEDTIQLGGMPPYLSSIRYTFTYPKVTIVLMTSLTQNWLLVMEWEWICRAYTKEMVHVMLLPQDEFAILEKLIPLTKKK